MSLFLRLKEAFTDLSPREILKQSIVEERESMEHHALEYAKHKARLAAYQKQLDRLK